MNENNPFSAQASFSGSAVLAAGNKTNTSLSPINWQSRLWWQLLFEFFWWQPTLPLLSLLSPPPLTFHLKVGCLRGRSPYCLLSMSKNIFNLQVWGPFLLNASIFILHSLYLTNSVVLNRIDLFLAPFLSHMVAFSWIYGILFSEEGLRPCCKWGSNHQKAQLGTSAECGLGLLAVPSVWNSIEKKRSHVL